MHKQNKYIYFNVVLIAWILASGQISAMTLSGSITASTVTVSGDVTVSSMTTSSMTVTNLLTETGVIKGLILQTVISSTTVNSTTTSTTPVVIPGLSASIRLSSPNNYVRISLDGILQASFVSPNTNPIVNLSIERDSMDLGSGAFISTVNLNGVPAALTIVDLPGDTSPHIYSATFDIDPSSGTIANFTASPIGYLILQEIAQ